LEIPRIDINAFFDDKPGSEESFIGIEVYPMHLYSCTHGMVLSPF